MGERGRIGIYRAPHHIVSFGRNGAVRLRRLQVGVTPPGCARRTADHFKYYHNAKTEGNRDGLHEWLSNMLTEEYT